MTAKMIYNLDRPFPHGYQLCDLGWVIPDSSQPWGGSYHLLVPNDWSFEQFIEHCQTRAGAITQEAWGSDERMDWIDLLSSYPELIEPEVVVVNINSAYLGTIVASNILYTPPEE